MSRPVIVELFGPAGTGKSSCLTPLRHALLQDGFSVRTSQDKVRFRALLVMPQLVWGAASLARYFHDTHSRPGFEEVFGRRYFAGLYLFYTRVSKFLRNWLLYVDGEYDVLLCEHGEFFFKADQNLHRVRGIKNSSPPTGILVSLVIPEKEMVERVYRRGVKKGPESNAIVSQDSFRLRYMRSFESVILGTESEVLSFRLNAARPLEEVVAEIEGFVLSSLRTIGVGR